MAWMILLRKFGPYLAVALLLTVVWIHGRSTGKAKWQGTYLEATQETTACREEISRASSEVMVLKTAIEQQNAHIEQQALEYQNRVKATQEAAQRILAQQATSYQRKLQDASEAASSLRERVRTIEQAEACHEAWLELIK